MRFTLSRPMPVYSPSPEFALSPNEGQKESSDVSLEFSALLELWLVEFPKLHPPLKLGV